MTRPPVPGSPAEDQDESGPSAQRLDPAALRASLRCGRSLPVRHLVDSDDAFAQGRYWSDLTVLCGVDVAEPDSGVADLDRHDCRDCLRYCPDCVREAARFSAEAGPARLATPSGGI